MVDWQYTKLAMFRLITIEREYGCGGAPIAAQLADHLGWKLWDHRLTEEIARLANVDPSAVRRWARIPALSAYVRYADPSSAT